MWTFSIYLESVAILPQLFMISKTGEAETITSHYLFALGAYRALYIVNWIYRYYFEGFYDFIAIVAGCVQTALYCDFFYLYITKGKDEYTFYWTWSSALLIIEVWCTLFSALRVQHILFQVVKSNAFIFHKGNNFFYVTCISIISDLNIKIIKKEMFTNPSQALDSQTNSPLHYHRKCIENSVENKQTNVQV